MVALIAVLLLLLAVPAGAPAATNRTETAVRTPAPDKRIVKESYVRLRAPMPESSPEHPAACDWISYLRFRHAQGPRRSTRADAVLVMMPGIFAGAGSFDQVARNTIRRAAKRRRHVEVWGLDRRSNCLEDWWGTRAGYRARDPRVSFGYYFYGQEADGRKFPGFASDEDAAFLRDVGLRQTIEDWHTIITREFPSQRMRKRKLICGGHSLGGPLTAALASWDFDGDPETTKDAGYNQCRAFVGLDTTVSESGGGGAGAGIATQAASQSGASPYVNAPPLTPKTLLAPALIGVHAFQEPDEESIIPSLVPRDPEWEVTQRVLFSRNPEEFATGSPAVRDFRVTNAAALAAIFDDNSSGVSIFRSSIGMYTGGPLVDKSFPAHDPTLAAPEQEHGPLYHWQTYEKVGLPAFPLEQNDEGAPYTSRDSEVTDIRQLGRALFQWPANFTEQYFPTRLVTDFAAMESGDRSGDLENLRHDGPSKRPILLVQAGDSDSNDPTNDEGPTKTGDKPNDKPLSREAILPGYNHLDVATAAWAQNDRRAEGSSQELVRFLLKVTPKPRRRAGR